MLSTRKTLTLAAAFLLFNVVLHILARLDAPQAIFQLLLALPFTYALLCAILQRKSLAGHAKRHWLWAALAGSLLAVSTIPSVLQLPADTAAFSAILAFSILCCGLLLRFFRLRASLPATPTASFAKASPLQVEAPTSPWLLFGAVLLLVFLSLCLEWSFYFPAGLTGDSLDQLEQVGGGIPYTNVHAIGHTLLLKAVMVVFGHYGVLVALQLLGLALLYACFAVFLIRKGVSLFWLLALLTVFTAHGSHAYQYAFLLKDTPYTLCVGLVTLLLVEDIERRADGKPLPLWAAIILGFALAFCMLFRSNGAVVLVLCSLYFIISFLRRRAFHALLAMLAAMVISIGGISLLSSAVLHTRSLPNGFAIAPIGKGIAAAVSSDIPLTGAQTQHLQSIFQQNEITFMKERYHPWDTHNTLLWHAEYRHMNPKPTVFDDRTMEVFNNRFVIALGEHPLEAFRLYLSLVPTHLMPLCKDVLYNTHILWGMDTQLPLFSHVVLATVLLLAMLAAWQSPTFKKHWAVLLPIAANALSIAISATTNEYRYLLPTFALFPVLLPYILATGRRSPALPHTTMEVHSK